MRNYISKIKYIAKSQFIMDIGRAEHTIIVAGMGRSGTTWGADIINYDKSYRVIFEPFFPAVVKEAKGFEYIQYHNPQFNNEVLVRQARKILAGKPKNRWVDRDNKGFFYRRRIIKDIRCNLMLGWLKKIAKETPIVLMIRHPLQVVSSWQKLGWGKEALGKRSDFDIITSQQYLLNDFPVIQSVMKVIDPLDFVERMVFQWCVFHLVPSKHLNKNEVHVLFYEQLLTNPEDEIKRLFQYLDKPFNWEKVRRATLKQSSTNFRKRDLTKNTTQLINSWKTEFTTKQIQRANYILAMFGLDGIYDEDGYPTG